MARYELEQPGMGTVRVIQDVEIAHFDATESVVIAARTIPLGERLLIELPDDRGGPSHTRLARAVNSRVVLRGNALRREVRLLITARPGEADDAAERFALEERRKPVSGAVIRRVPVRIVQVRLVRLPVGGALGAGRRHRRLRRRAHVRSASH